MKLSEAAAALPGKVLTGDFPADPEISTVYTCDLLSRVMSMSEKDCIWITVLTHLNVVAVAQLADIACIVIPEDIPVPESTVKKAEEEQICILSTPLSTYELSWRLHDLINGKTEDA